MWSIISAGRARSAGRVAGPARIFSRENAEAELRAARGRGIQFIALVEPDYPPWLQMIDDAPPLLAVRGKISVLGRPLIAIVGSRMLRPPAANWPGGWRAI